MKPTSRYLVGLLTLTILVDFRLSAKIDQYRRSVLSLLEVTGILGGIFEVFDIVFGSCIGFVTAYFFKNELHERINQSYDEIEALKLKIQTLEQKEINTAKNNGALEEEKKVEYTKSAQDHFRTFHDQIQLSRKSRYNSVSNQEPSYIPEVKEHNRLKDFKAKLDCINIVESIEKLQIKVDYLLKKDPDYEKDDIERFSPSISKISRSQTKIKPSASFVPTIRHGNDEANSMHMLKNKVALNHRSRTHLYRSSNNEED